MIRADPGCRSLLFTPFVATSAWYATTLLHLWIVNGRLRYDADVMAMAWGALIVGLPVSIFVTLFLAAPLYRVLEDGGRLTRAAALVGGGVIGCVVSLVFWLLEGRQGWDMPLWQGAAIGVISGAGWHGWRAVLSKIDAATSEEESRGSAP